MILVKLMCISCRRDLLKLIGVREFSLEANYQDPCQSFVLPGVHLGNTYSYHTLYHSLSFAGDLRVL